MFPPYWNTSKFCSCSFRAQLTKPIQLRGFSSLASRKWLTVPSSLRTCYKEMIEFESVKDHHPSWFCIWNNDDTTFNPYVLSKMFKIYLTWLSPKNHIEHCFIFLFHTVETGYRMCVGELPYGNYLCTKTLVCSNSKRLSTVLCTVQTMAKSQIDYQITFRNLSFF